MIQRELLGISAVWWREFKVFWREKSRIVSSVVQPMMWLFLFGSGIGASSLRRLRQLSRLHLSGRADHVGHFRFRLFRPLHHLGPQARCAQSRSGRAGNAHQHLFRKSTRRLHRRPFAGGDPFCFFFSFPFGKSLGHSAGLVDFAHHLDCPGFTGTGAGISAGEPGRISGDLRFSDFPSFLLVRCAFSGGRQTSRPGFWVW